MDTFIVKIKVISVCSKLFVECMMRLGELEVFLLLFGQRHSIRRHLMTHELKRYAQYTGNHMKIILWPHLLPTSKNSYRKGLRTTQQNKAVHLVTQTLKANKNIRFFTLTNACNLNNKPLDQTIPD